MLIVNAYIVAGYTVRASNLRLFHYKIGERPNNPIHPTLFG